MTTNFDQASSPGRQEGETIVSVTANGSTAASATVIPAASGWTIALVTTTSTNYAIQLPAGASVGDVVEIYATGSGNPRIYAASGESFITPTPAGDGAITMTSNVGGSSLRKVSSSTWAGIISG